MFPEDIGSVTASYHRCMHSDRFTDTFYILFLASSEEVRTKFQFTDLVRQKLALRQSLLTMILFSVDPEHHREALEQLAIRHDRNHADIAPHLYTLWLKTLCMAIEQHDPEFSAEVEQLWIAAMQPGIDLIISRYEPPRAACDDKHETPKTC